MSQSVDYKELVEKAQHGDDESLNRLSEHSRQRLYAYVYRLTMREELSQDVVQESMLEMFRFLDKLERADRFWPWLRRIALNKVYHHYTREKAHRTVPLSEEGYEGAGEQEHEGLANLVSQELKQIVSDTMVHLRARYREVLVMRCYEDMGYAQIAEELGCTEFNARVLFFRAKKSLAKQLSRRGLGKGALLTALVVFGKITAPSEAAASQIAVTAAATKVGFTAALAGTAGSKAGIVSLAAASVITVGTVMVATQEPPELYDASGIANVSVTSGVSGAGQANPAVGSLQIPGNLRQDWWFFPDGPDKSVMMRKMKPDKHGKQPYCRWLQNNLGNYYLDRKRSTVSMTNHRMYSEKLSVMRLPT
ncbi:MAG: RNA polymerase sigma factor, partial [Candidatus Pacebacteria bacterium]|nr:RNA polymerase sigma factor [Candidatus Paceibacterota bacterium]